MCMRRVFIRGINNYSIQFGLKLDNSLNKEKTFSIPISQPQHYHSQTPTNPNNTPHKIHNINTNILTNPFLKTHLIPHTLHPIHHHLPLQILQNTDRILIKYMIFNIMEKLSNLNHIHNIYIYKESSIY